MPTAVSIVCAAHLGTWSGGAIEWESVLVQEPIGGERIELVAPLPADTQVIEGRAFRDEQGRITAFEAEGYRTFLRLRQPDGGDVLSVPLASGLGLQRVSLEGAWFEPDAGLGLDKHIGFWSQPGIEREQRRSCDNQAVAEREGRKNPLKAAVLGRSMDAAEQRGHNPLYLVADDRLARGLHGELRSHGPAGAGVAWAAGGAFGLLLGGLFAGHRMLERRVRQERIHRYLRDNMPDLADEL